VRAILSCVLPQVIDITGLSLDRHQRQSLQSDHTALHTISEMLMYQRILVPVDGSPTSNAGLTEAMKLAKLTGAQLRLIHVVDDMPFVMSAEGYGAMSGDVLSLLRDAGQGILQQARSLVKDQGIAVDTVLYDNLGARLCDRVTEEATQWNADLVVLGTHGRRGVRRALLGSDAEQIVRMSPVPVLLVRTGEAAAPATQSSARHAGD